MRQVRNVDTSHNALLAFVLNIYIYIARTSKNNQQEET